MLLSIPFKSNGEAVALELIQVAVFSPDFKAVTDTGQDITNEVDFGKHYRGVIAGNPNSLVSISVFENQVSGFIANAEGNYSLGKLKDSETDHIIYKDSDFFVHHLRCGRLFMSRSRVSYVNNELIQYHSVVE